MSFMILPAGTSLSEIKGLKVEKHNYVKDGQTKETLKIREGNKLIGWTKDGRVTIDLVEPEVKKETVKKKGK